METGKEAAAEKGKAAETVKPLRPKKRKRVAVRMQADNEEAEATIRARREVTQL